MCRDCAEIQRFSERQADIALRENETKSGAPFEAIAKPSEGERT
jgi:hypothetical protein